MRSCFLEAHVPAPAHVSSENGDVDDGDARDPQPIRIGGEATDSSADPGERSGCSGQRSLRWSTTVTVHGVAADDGAGWVALPGGEQYGPVSEERAGGVVEDHLLPGAGGDGDAAAAVEVDRAGHEFDPGDPRGDLVERGGDGGWGEGAAPDLPGRMAAVHGG